MKPSGVFRIQNKSVLPYPFQSRWIPGAPFHSTYDWHRLCPCCQHSRREYNSFPSSHFPYRLPPERLCCPICAVRLDTVPLLCSSNHSNRHCAHALPCRRAPFRHSTRPNVHALQRRRSTHPRHHSTRPRVCARLVRTAALFWPRRPHRGYAPPACRSEFSHRSTPRSCARAPPPQKPASGAVPRTSQGPGTGKTPACEGFSSFSI